MTRRIFGSAVFAGLAAGLVAALLQFALVTPLLLEGEVYEAAAAVNHSHGADGSLAHDQAATAAQDHEHAPAAQGADVAGADLARHGLTLAMSLVAYTGFALVLVAAVAVAARRGHGFDARRGLIWGLAGFAAFQLAPAAGLPPELPGSVAAELSARQFWWFATVAATAAGLAFMVFGRGTLALIGAVLIALPHLVGAPHPAAGIGVAPPELAALFATRSLAVGAVAWAVLGAVAGYAWSRPEPA